MWVTFAGAVLLATIFLVLMLRLWRHSQAVRTELSIHRREHLSRRLQSLVLGSAVVATGAFALHATFILQALDQRAYAREVAAKPVVLRLDSELSLR